MFTRNVVSSIELALADTPVVLLNGPRQSGKSTLGQSLVADRPGHYMTLDDAPTLAAVRADPAAFLTQRDGLLVIDEVQRAPELFVAIKASVDRDRRAGRYLLTGSANVMLVPTISESLAGRMEILPLWPLSQGEIEGCRERFIEALFAAEFPSSPLSEPIPMSSYIERVLAGGFPEARSRRNGRRRAWFNSYITALLERDVRDLSNIQGLSDLPRLLALLADRTGQLLNVADLSRNAGIAQRTLDRYLTMLRTIYTVELLPAWSGSLTRRLTRSPKLQMVDSGLAAFLRAVTAEGLNRNMTAIGPLLETFVSMELRKQAVWNDPPVTLMHFRSYEGAEVDIVLETPSGLVAGIEVKSSTTIGEKDFQGLKTLRSDLGERFHRGLLLYCGREILPFGDRLYAAPVSALWQLNSVPNS